MEALQRLLAQSRDYWAGLSPFRRAVVLGGALIVAVVVGTIAYFGSAGDYQTLYAGLPPDETGAITSRLQALGIPYKLGANGTAITVPADRIAQTKVTLAAEGIPNRGGKGYELFDESSLGTTPFVQNVNYQRALQSELARSIMQLEPISFARVLIAKPDSTPFIRDQRPPTASVVLKLKPGTALNRSMAASIVSLVARSVEGLKPENVTVVDSNGRLLSDPHAGDKDDLPAGHLEYRRDLEAHLAAKAEEMLSRHLGPGRAIVRVTADINFQKVKERRETYSPEDRAVAAERLTTTKSSGAAKGGAAGATSNISRAGGSASSGSGSSSQEEVISTDYLVSKSVREMEDRMGTIRRLTIAAMADLSPGKEAADGTPAPTPISLADAQEIIKQAIGFQTGRDEIKVSDVRLDTGIIVAGVDEEGTQYMKIQTYVSIARNFALGIGVLIAVGTIALLLLRRGRPAPAPTPEAAAENRRQDMMSRFAEQARSDPAKMAEVFSMLMGTAPAR